MDRELDIKGGILKELDIKRGILNGKTNTDSMGSTSTEKRWILKGPRGGGHFDGKTKMVYRQRPLSATCSIADIRQLWNCGY